MYQSWNNKNVSNTSWKNIVAFTYNWIHFLFRLFFLNQNINTYIIHLYVYKIFYSESFCTLCFFIWFFSSASNEYLQMLHVKPRVQVMILPCAYHCLISSIDCKIKRPAYIFFRPITIKSSDIVVFLQMLFLTSILRVNIYC